MALDAERVKDWSEERFKIFTVFKLNAIQKEVVDTKAQLVPLTSPDKTINHSSRLSTLEESTDSLKQSNNRLWGFIVVVLGSFGTAIVATSFYG